MSNVPSNLIPTRITQLPMAPVASEDGLLLFVYQGNSYQIRAGDLLSVAGVPTSRQVIAGTGMTGGGPLATDITLSVAVGGIGTSQLAASGATPGTYGSSTTVPVFTVDTTGRVMSITNVAVAVSGYVPESRQVIAGTGLTGGGALNANVTLVANLSDSTPASGFQTGASGVATSIARSDHKHPAVDLANDDEVDGLLGLSNGGTAKSLVPDAGAIIWSGADGLYVSVTGSAGQVLVSGGTSAPTWGSAIIISDQPANVVYAGPASGPNAPSAFRALVTADLPSGTGTVTSVAALTLGTTGTDLSSTVANGTTTPVITLNVPTASASNRGALSAADWSTFNNKQQAGAYLSAVDADAPLTGYGTSASHLSIPAATSLVNGYLTSADWATFNTKGDVVGPAGATNNNIAVFDAATGKLIKDGGTLGTAAFTASTAYDVAGAAAAVTPTSLSLVIGTNVQAYDADLTTWAGITPGTGVGTALANTAGAANGVATYNQLGTAAFTAATAYATATQGGKADTALQPSTAVTVTSVNGNTITTGTGTLTLAAGKTLTANDNVTLGTGGIVLGNSGGLTAATSKVLTVNNSLTLSGTDASTLNVGTGGTLGTAAYTAATAYATSTQGTTADNAIPKTQNALTQEPTGFAAPDAVISTYDSTARTVTLTGTVSAYWQGTLVSALVSGWVSAAHTATTGGWFLYYNGSAFVWSQTPWTFDMMQIAYVWYGTADKFGIRETHGLMQWQTHEEFHQTVGTYLVSGGDLAAYTLASTTAANRRPTVSATTVQDEDLETVNATLTSSLYTQLYLAGAGATPTWVLDAAEIVPVLAANPYYNQFLTGAWTQTLLPNNAYMAVWLVAVPTMASATGQKYRYQWIQGQSQSNTLATIQAQTPSSLNLAGLTGVSTEWVFIARVIIRFAVGNWTFIQVDKLLGNKASTVTSPAGSYLSAVTTDTTLTGDGTAINPLTVAHSPALLSATTVVNVSGATAPAAGQILTATSSTAATWQGISGGTF